MGEIEYFLFKEPSGGFMDDCYHEVRCRDVPFIENGYYGIVLSHRSTSKRFFSQENRFLSTPSKSVKMVTFPSLKEK